MRISQREEVGRFLALVGDHLIAGLTSFCLELHRIGSGFCSLNIVVVDLDN